jgi:hypothetical protein
LILIPKFRRILQGPRGGKLGFHANWRVGPYIDESGRMRPAYTRGNTTHDLGEQALLQLIFGLQFTTFSWQVVANDCSFDLADGTQDKYITDEDGGDPFANMLAGDKIYLCGGYTAAGTSVTPGYYTTDVVTDANNISLTADATAGNTDITGGIVAIRTHNFGIGLDARPTLAEADTTATAEAYEEDGTDYYRYIQDPIESKWTIAQNATSLDYEATSTQVTWTAGAADWQTNKNAFLVMGLADVATDVTRATTGDGAGSAQGDDWSNDVLLSSVAFDDPILTGSGQTLPLQIVWKLTEES